MRPRQVVIRGLYVKIFMTKSDGSRGMLHKSRLVSPEFIELWFKVHDGDFDLNMWQSLSQKDKNFFTYCVHQAGIENQKLEIALAHSTRDFFERMKILEMSIVAGNLNADIVREFNKIIDMLAESAQISKTYATKQKNKMKRTAIAHGVELS
jgi:hypothetical protein